MVKKYTLTKKISKHGNKAMIAIPKFLQDELRPNTIVEVKINVIKEGDKNEPQSKNI